MVAEFSTLERNILKAKGLDDDQIARLNDWGIVGRSDFSGFPHCLSGGSEKSVPVPPSGAAVP